MSPPQSPEHDGTQALVPSVVLGDRYRLDYEIGRGGMATVYRATDLRLHRDVAVKLFRQDVAEAMDALRIRREIELLAGGRGPNIVSILDAETEDAADFYLVMELVEGMDLRRLLKAEQRLDPDLTRRIAADIAAALAELHRRGVVHRDIKPANVLVPTEATTRRGGIAAKLSDFGIAVSLDGTRVTSGNLVIGTPAYMSPEQVAGEPVGPASDVYSLGLVLRECLSGRIPFAGTTTEAAIARLSREPDVPAGLTPELVRLLSRMNARAPEDRPTAEEVAKQFDGPLVGRMVLAGAREERTVARAGDAPTEVRPVPASEAHARAEAPTTLKRSATPTGAPAAVDTLEEETAADGAPEAPAKPRRRRTLTLVAAAATVVAVAAGGGVFLAATHAAAGPSKPVMSVAVAGHRYLSAVCPANAAAVRVSDARKGTNLALMRRAAAAADKEHRASIALLQRSVWPEAVRGDIAMIVGHLQLQDDVYVTMAHAHTIREALAKRSKALDPAVFIDARKALHLPTDTTESCAAYR